MSDILLKLKEKDCEGIVTSWFGKGFGEALVASLFCHILLDNGIPAVHKEHRNSRGLLDVPTLDSEAHKDWTWWRWGYRFRDIPILVQQVGRVNKWLEKDIQIDRRKRNHIPVIFKEMDVPSYDVVMNTATGKHTPFKAWPYFGELTALFRAHRISYLDLDANWKRDMECLNLVKNAKLYLGLDTGMSHYVSKFANGKALIINGGFVTFNFWAFLYDFEPIIVEDVPCRPCWINSGDIRLGLKQCTEDHMCMRQISPKMVFNRVYERLKR